ncbi:MULTISPECIES: arginine--tRNA ligase [unclassified Campylobacter]|uniref:arginine--tRNA ligase n=1 Tax=unclassified Campylobacter TaxID=2593542 RepID=UPI001237A72E|nr:MULTISPECIES: arginine--tRNA ligase [unclassified Campylobacter]KAA6226370.1 arginine--tRNA ligase [Campylobacter sp. LR286c]KAA6226592.1 arginine--tRNA ligase [Campylobacter sp. LR185c]KAA6226862.1 arginine--tRNA ligase [Campylobacter sp. LR196d]KAA6230299.1 arginine--tRNA ligase [Campylobacter sp. LR291e]KAA6233820.1 arginine--tRNA ligase [Campylobacter sp. LR264d]
MKNIVYKEIYQILNRDFILENPKDKNLAHFATPLAFSLAKEFKKSPNVIAQDLVCKFKENDLFERVEAVNGYLNFKLSKGFLNTLATKSLTNSKDFARGKKKDKSFLLEYISANPTGPLHIGHARGAIFGDSLTRIARHLGYKFDTEYYINDAGNQIALLGKSVFLRVKIDLLKENVSFDDDCYKGDYILDLAKKALAKFNEVFFKDGSNIKELADWAKDEMLILIKQDLENVRIKIDSYVSEKSLYNALNSTLLALKESGGTYEMDNKIWLASTRYKDEKDRVIIKDDGSGTYLAADIVYHKDKMSRGYDKCINIWGADHHGYIARMKAAMAFLGFNPDNLEVILAQMVSLLKDGKPYKMSKRAGSFVLMSEVIDEIGVDCLRFMFLSKKCDTHLEFELNALKKQDSSNPVFYINYAHARIHQLFIKAELDIKDIINEDLQGLNEDGINLLFESLNLSSVLNDAFESRSLQKLCDYLKNLASLFHKFYNENRVVGSKYEKMLLKLFAVVSLSIKTAFDLMGIKALDRMEH